MHALQVVGYFQSYQLTWSYFFDQLVAGLTLGSLYGLIALGYSMVYGILKLLNFAHGEVFMIGSYIGYFVLTAFGGAASPDIPVALLIALMFAAAMLGAGVPRCRDRAVRLPAPPGEAGAADRSADQRARRLVLPAADRRHLLRCDAEAVRHVQPRRRQVLHEHHHRTLRDPVHAALRDRGLGRPHGALTLFVARTQIGRAMRATSFDLEAASMMGIDVDRVIVVTFFIGSALAGAAGVMNGLIFQNVDPYVGFQVGLIAFTAAVVGGIGSMPGAMLGGLAIGLGRAFSIGYVSSSYQDVIVFGDPDRCSCSCDRPGSSASRRRRRSE